MLTFSFLKLYPECNKQLSLDWNQFITMRIQNTQFPHLVLAFYRNRFDAHLRL